MNEPALDPTLEHLADQLLAEIEGVAPVRKDDPELRSLRAAADLATAALVAVAPPRALLTRLRSDALRHLAEAPRPVAPARATAPTPAVRNRWLAPFLLGAAAAAAAVLLLGPSPSTAPEAATPQAAYGALAADPLCNLKLAFQPGPSPMGAQLAGDVVWSDARQQGYLRFRGLPQLDPATQQFQLWIFDRDRSAEQPVDGGLFDAAAGEVLVPIDAKLPVHHATAFALTVEPRGGVVVSRREHLVAVAGL